MCSLNVYCVSCCTFLLCGRDCTGFRYVAYKCPFTMYVPHSSELLCTSGYGYSYWLLLCGWQIVMYCVHANTKVPVCNTCIVILSV